MYVKSNRTGKYGYVSASDNEGFLVTIEDLPQKKIKRDVFEKQFTIVSDKEGKAALSTIYEEDNTMPTRSEAKGTGAADSAEKTVDAPKTEKAEKAEKKTGRPQVSGDHPLWFVAKNYVEDMGANHEVGPEGKVKGFRSFKVNGNMFCNINFNKNGITLWVRQEAVKDVRLPADVEVKPINHMFDGRVHFADNTPENIKAIQEILTASSKYQVEKKSNTKKAVADKKREEKAKKAAEKAAAAPDTTETPDAPADAGVGETPAE